MSVNLKDKIKKFKNVLQNKDYEFLERIYSTQEENYQQRIKQIGFIGKDKVLDLGCGFGQWTRVLAEQNKAVCAVDVCADRLIVAKEINSDVDNIEFRYGNSMDIPYKDNTFDIIFSYSVFHFVEPYKALKEMYRVLKPNGKIYMTVNGIGFYLNYWIDKPNAILDYNPREETAKVFMNSMSYFDKGIFIDGYPLMYEREQLVNIIKECDFNIIDVDDEGKISTIGDNTNSISFFKGEYYGQNGVFEILFEKKGKE